MAKPKQGRPSLGVTRKVSITLTEDEWVQIWKWQDEGHFASLSEYFRGLHSLAVKK